MNIITGLLALGLLSLIASCADNSAEMRAKAERLGHTINVTHAGCRAGDMAACLDYQHIHENCENACLMGAGEACDVCTAGYKAAAASLNPANGN